MRVERRTRSRILFLIGILIMLWFVGHYYPHQHVSAFTKTRDWMAANLPIQKLTPDATTTSVSPPGAHLKDWRSALNHPKSFHAYSNVSAIPLPVKAAFAKRTKREPFAMAEPGAEWQATDIDDPALPDRRLLSVAASGSLWILFYEVGGRAHSYHACAFWLDHGQGIALYHGAGFEPLDTPSKLLDAIETHGINDDPGIYW